MTKYSALLSLLLCLVAIPAPLKGQTAGNPPDQPPSFACVILLHGLGRGQGSMDKMARALTAAGFLTFNLDYPSRQKPIAELAPMVIGEGLKRCTSQKAKTIHFVTHSLGGMILRCYLSDRKIAGLGRVVMLSPPNQGSEAADYLRDWRFYRWYFGPAGQQLGTGKDGLAATLGAVDFPLGIITGNRHSFFDAWLSKVIPGPDDGKVSVERAKVPGMTDFLVLPYGHAFIMKEDKVIAQTLSFLQHGKFLRQGPGS
jgi:pimeloyl-ACP methyl ester carboxylesterase